MNQIDETILLLFEALDRKENIQTREKLHKLLKKRIKSVLSFSSNYMLGMLKDDERNKYYQKLLKDKVKEKSVLEIGTGIGFLATLIAKNGAKKVVSCEGDSYLYQIAQKVINENNIDNCELISGTSFDLDKSYEGQFDYIVHELFSNNLFSENVLTTLKDAKRFLKPNGKILPGRVKLWAIPVDADAYVKSIHLSDSCGVNLSKSDELFFEKPIVLSDKSLVKTFEDDAQLIFDIDFNESFSLEGREVVDFPYEQNKGLLFYFSLEDIEGKMNFSTFSKEYQGHWKPVVFISSGKKNKELEIIYQLNMLQVKLREKK